MPNKQPSFAVILLFSCGLGGCDFTSGDLHPSPENQGKADAEVEDAEVEIEPEPDAADDAPDAAATDASEDATPNDSGLPPLPCGALSTADDVLLEVGDCRAVHGIAGGSGRVAVATAKGTLYFDLRSGTATFEGFLPFASVTQANFPWLRAIAMSSDGALLASARTILPEATAAADPDDPRYRGNPVIFSLPSGQTQWLWSSLNGNTAQVTLARGGTRFGRTEWSSTSPNTTGLRYVTNLRGITTYFSALYTLSILDYHFAELALSLSPDGSLVAAPDGTLAGDQTKIYRDGSLIGAVDGWAVGWIDDARLLVQTYKWNTAKGWYPNGAPEPPWDKSLVVDPEGNVLASPMLPEIEIFDTVDATRIYVPAKNTIYSLDDGSPVWTSPRSQGGPGAIAGPYVVYASGERVFIESY